MSSIVKTLAISMFASAAWVYVVKPWLDGADRQANTGQTNTAESITDDTRGGFV